MTETRIPCGLLSLRGRDRELVPLTGVLVHAELRAAAARICVVQGYENREPFPIEAMYVFPLEEGSTVCGFAATLGRKRIEGKVRPKEEAFAGYHDALSRGQGAFLLEQEQPNVLTAMVGTLLPGEKTEIEISYVTELSAEGGALRLRLPAAVAPRCDPRRQRTFSGLTDAERPAPHPSSDPSAYELRLVVDAHLLAKVRAVESPTHPIRAELGGARVRVLLPAARGGLDRDFVLLLETEGPQRPASCQTRAPGKGRFALVAFRPQIPAERRAVEVVFLVDCSGSMHGPSLRDARRTLRLCLHSLREGDRFNIVRFGSTHEALFPESRPYDDATLREADRWAAGLRADLGGTEILAPLREVLEGPFLAGRQAQRRRSLARAGPGDPHGPPPPADDPPRGAAPSLLLPRCLILLTDGEVGNEDEVIALARRHRETAQIHAFGIGPGASEYLVRGVARATRGAAEFVRPGERIEDKVLRQFLRLGQLQATDLSLEWEGLEAAEVGPAQPPPLFPGEGIAFLARITGGRSGKARLRGRLGEQELLLEAVVPPVRRADGHDAVLPLLWARRRIREIEEGDAMTRGRGFGQLGPAREEDRRARQEAEEELVRLGKRFGLLSSATSFVLVEQRSPEERAQGRARLRRVPVALSAGWGGTTLPGPGAFLSEAPLGHPASGEAGRSYRRDDPSGMQFDLPGIGSERMGEHPVVELLLAQNADGSWEIEPGLATLCKSHADRLRRRARELAHPLAERILATHLALLLLRQEMEREEGSWAEVLRKGEEWIRRYAEGVAPPDGSPDLWEWAGSARSAYWRP